MESERKLLFQEIITVKIFPPDFSDSYKKWNKLILKEIGILDNLLSDYMNNNLWNIILDYLQIPFPKININENTANRDISISCKYCINYVKTPDKLGYFNFRSYNHYIYCAICKSCLFDNECTDENFKKYCNKSINIRASMVKIRRQYSNMLLWLGLIDFDIFYYRKI